jgi:hypothetical protein
MNKTIVASVALIALGAGTLGVQAPPLDLYGSITLTTLVSQVIAQCSGATGAINYIGIGSGAGENGMVAGTQSVAPMSRFLAGTGVSGICAVDASKAEAIEIAGEAIAITANDMHRAACDPQSGSVADLTCQGYTSNNGGLANNKTLLTGVILSSWKDTLRLVYFGIAPNDLPFATGTGPGDQVLAVNIARRDCLDPSRLELVNSYGKLYQLSCGSDAGCVKLQHAFRLAESARTTDFFRETLGLESGTQTGNKGFPFCNEYVPAVTLNSTNLGSGTCVTNADCTGASSLCDRDGKCHRPNNGCTVATSAADCDFAAGFTCDPGQGQCAKVCTIGSDAACQAALPNFATDPRLATCVPAGTCTQKRCTADTDCGGAVGACDTVLRVCTLICNADADCGGAVGSCDTTAKLCRLPQSRRSCSTDSQCPGPGTFCSLPADMNSVTGWCAKKVDAPITDAAEAAEPRCAIPGLVGGTSTGTVATIR